MIYRHPWILKTCIYVYIQCVWNLKNVYIRCISVYEIEKMYIYTVYEILRISVYMYIYNVYEFYFFCLYDVYIHAIYTQNTSKCLYTYRHIDTQGWKIPIPVSWPYSLPLGDIEKLTAWSEWRTFLFFKCLYLTIKN